MSIGRQVLREILGEIETEFFRRLEDPEKCGAILQGTMTRERVKLEYQRSVTKVIADYLDKVYLG